jgi:hypothetical protein
MGLPVMLLGLLEREPSHDAWLSEPVPPEPDLQSELFAKVVIALLLGDVIAQAVRR